MLDIKLTEEMLYVCHQLWWEMFIWGSLSPEEIRASNSFGPAHEAWIKVRENERVHSHHVYCLLLRSYTDHADRTGFFPPDPFEYVLPSPDPEKLGRGILQLKELINDPTFLDNVEAIDKLTEKYNELIHAGTIRRYCQHCGKPIVIRNELGALLYCEDKCLLQETVIQKVSQEATKKPRLTYPQELQEMQRLIDQASEPDRTVAGRSVGRVPHLQEGQINTSAG